MKPIPVGDGRTRIVSFRFRESVRPSILGGLRGRLHAALFRIFGVRYANTPLPGYVSPSGSNKYDMIFDRDGPASYVNTGTFGTSGDAFSVNDIGMGGIEDMGADMMSSDGVNVVEVVLGQNVAAGTFNLSKGIPAVTASIHWFTNPTRGTEVTNATNLSTKFIRLRAVLV